MEPAGIVAVPGDPAGGLTFWAATQGPHGVRDELAAKLGLDASVVRGANAAVGGGFGAKAGAIVEYLIVCKAALLLGRPVKWTETRSENMLAMWHGRGHVHYVEMGLRRDGKIAGLRVRTLADAGAYPAVGAFLPFFTQMMSQNVYVIPKVEFNWQAAVTNTTPVAAYRGAGRPEAIHLVERTLDIAADELGIDPVEIRRTNFIPPEAFPFADRDRPRRDLRQRRVRQDARRRDREGRLRHLARRAGGAARAGRHQDARHRRRVVPRDQRAARPSTVSTDRSRSKPTAR